MIKREQWSVWNSRLVCTENLDTIYFLPFPSVSPVSTGNWKRVIANVKMDLGTQVKSPSSLVMLSPKIKVKIYLYYGEDWNTSEFVLGLIFLVSATYCFYFQSRFRKKH